MNQVIANWESHPEKVKKRALASAMASMRAAVTGLPKDRALELIDTLYAEVKECDEWAGDGGPKVDDV